MLDARVQVRRKRAILTEELLAHAPDGRRSVNLELGYAIRTLIPAREKEPDKIRAMVVVQMAEEHMGDIHCTLAALEQPVMCAGPGVWPW